ncbi:MAG: LysO family transporter [Prevotella sp.]|nr:LysO family transporter [Prevotella sp.]
MFRILFLLFLGIGIGYLMRNLRGVRHVEKTTRLTIFALLFVFGITIGSNHSLLNNIAYFGWQAVVIAVFGIVGSFGASYLFNRVLTKKGKQK